MAKGDYEGAEKAALKGVHLLEEEIASGLDAPYLMSAYLIAVANVYEVMGEDEKARKYDQKVLNMLAAREPCSTDIHQALRRMALRLIEGGRKLDRYR